MGNIIEIARRCKLSTHDGMACGPFSLTSIEAEIEVEEDGIKKFLHSSWVSEAPDSISFEANNESIFDLLVNDGDIDKLESIRAKSKEEFGEPVFSDYRQQIEMLLQMIKIKIIEEELYDEDELQEVLDEMVIV